MIGFPNILLHVCERVVNASGWCGDVVIGCRVFVACRRATD